MHIAVLGAGSWGTTLAVLLSYNAHQVTLWSHRDDETQAMRESRHNTPFLPGVTIPIDIDITSDISEAVADAELVVSAVPSQFIRSAAQQLTSHDFTHTVVVNVAKGIENNSLMTVSEVLDRKSVV
jgi:glycerol-3-phosphate dehydrogenase (NAD(P)+)